MPPNTNSGYNEKGFEDEPEISLAAGDVGGDKDDDGSVLNLEKEPPTPPQRRKCGWCMIASFVITSSVIIAFIVIAFVYESQPTQAPTPAPASKALAIQCFNGKDFDYDYTVCNSANDGYSRESGYCVNGLLTPSRTENAKCESDRPYCQMCGDNSYAVCVSDKTTTCADIEANTCPSSLSYTVSMQLDCDRNDPAAALYEVPGNKCTNGQLTPPSTDLPYECSAETNAVLTECLDCGQGLASCVNPNQDVKCEDIFVKNIATDVPTTPVPTTATPTTPAPTNPGATPNPTKTPTKSPTPEPTTSPTNAVPQPLPPATISLANYCRDDPTSSNFESNAQKMQKFLANRVNSPIYVVEFLNFDTQDEAEAYQNFLEKLGGGSRLAFFLTRSSQWQSSDRPLWSHGFVMEYPTAASFVTLYLNNNQTPLYLTNSRGTDEYSVYLATKKTSGFTKFPDLFALSSTTPTPDVFSFHGLKFEQPNGRALVGSFDQQTHALKTQYGITALGWLDTSSGAACSNAPTLLELDQIRIEGVRSLGEFGSILQDPKWNSASLLRQQGITVDSFSGFAEHNQIVNSIYQ